MGGPKQQAYNAANSGAFNANSRGSSLYNTLWGPGGGGSGGAVSGFLNPASLNVSQPTGVYAQQYGNAASAIDTGAANALAQNNRQAANMGFGPSSPAGWTQNQNLQTNLAAAGAKGQAYQTATSQQYQDALNNFWKAANMASGTSTNQLNNSQQSYNQLYGSSPTGAATASNILSDAGQVQTGITCVCEGTVIKMADGTEEAVERIRSGNKVAGIDGEPCTVFDLEVSYNVPAMAITTEVGEQGPRFLVASESHTLARRGGGYCAMRAALGQIVETNSGPRKVMALKAVGPRRVYRLRLNASHSYLTDGIWSLE